MAPPQCRASRARPKCGVAGQNHRMRWCGCGAALATPVSSRCLLHVLDMRFHMPHFGAAPGLSQGIWSTWEAAAATLIAELSRRKGSPLTVGPQHGGPRQNARRSGDEGRTNAQHSASEGFYEEARRYSCSAYKGRTNTTRRIALESTHPHPDARSVPTKGPRRGSRSFRW